VTHLQPQGSDEDCCCGGSGDYVPSCSCQAWGGKCSIGWSCYYPVLPGTTLPTLYPERFRIIRVEDPIVVLVDSTQLSGSYQVPADTNAEFAVQYCCELTADECVWVDLWRGTINNADDPCDLFVAGLRHGINGDDTLNGGYNIQCDAVLRFFGAAEKDGFDAPGIVKLQIDNTTAYSGLPVSTVGCIPGEDITCGAALNCSPTQSVDVLTGTYYADSGFSIPAYKSTVQVKATNEAGTIAACNMEVPCYWHYNAIRIEVPDWTGLSLSCAGGDPKPLGFDGGTSLLYWRQNWSTEVELTGTIGGSYVIYSCDDGTLVTRKILTTGTFTYTYTESGRVRYYDPASPTVRLEGAYSRTFTYTAVVEYSLFLDFYPGYTDFSSQGFVTDPIFSPPMSIVGGVIAQFDNGEIDFDYTISDPSNAYKPTIGGASCGYDTDGTFSVVLTEMRFDSPFIMGITEFERDINCYEDPNVSSTITWEWYEPFFYQIVHDTPEDPPDPLCQPPLGGINGGAIGVAGDSCSCINEGDQVLNTETLLFEHLLIAGGP